MIYLKQKRFFNNMPNKFTIREAHEGLVRKDFSSAELTRACLERIADTEPELHSFLDIYNTLALDSARRADEEGIVAGNYLQGIPAAIKDVINIAGQKTTAGSKILHNYTAPYDASVILKLKKAGAVFLGKTNPDEFACGSSTENSAYGPSKNPWDTSRVPGGSSGGSGSAVAAGQCIYSLGSDTGGSIRQPAAFCGIVGLKPTYGRVSRYGLLAMASSLDQIGPMTKNVEDAAIVLSCIAGHDASDSTTSPHHVPDFLKNLKGDIKDLKIGIPKEYFIKGLDADVEKLVKQAIKVLEGRGAKVNEVSLPHSKYSLPDYYIIMPSELSSNLARYDGVKYGFSAQEQTLLDNYIQTRGRGFGAEIRRRIMLGTYTLSAGYYDAYYLQAQKVRTKIINDFIEAFKEVDCLITPTSPTVAFKIGEKTDDPLSMYLSDIYTVSANIAGIPGISIPCGFSKPKGGEKQMPVGLQILGKHLDEATILKVAYAYESETQWHKVRPEI